MPDRTAVDTIKGYFYQFDYAIAKLLELKQDTDTIVVEGIEDVDISTATEATAVQCKYYAKTEYNHSVIARPIRLMLDHYNEAKKGTKQRINYKLYGFFNSGQDKLTLPIDIIFLKDKYLTYTEKNVKHFHHTLLGLTDVELADFLSLLSIDIQASEYEKQLTTILALLARQFNCSHFEAEHFYYNNALKIIKDIAVDGVAANRRISKSVFLTKINYKRVLFNQWYITYKGAKKLFKELRGQYFTMLNISPFERFFTIEVPTVSYSRPELKDVLFTISKKWSKLSPREAHPFCPYVYLHGISPQELLELKTEIHSEGFFFVDGFDFCGATFNPKSIARPVNNFTAVKLKILNEFDHIEQTIREITKTKEIYQFYITSPFLNTNYANAKHVNIQFYKLADIKEII